MRDVKDLTNISDEIKESVFKKIDRESVCPCSACSKQLDCMRPQECRDYRRWRKIYLERIRRTKKNRNT